MCASMHVEIFRPQFNSWYESMQIEVDETNDNYCHIGLKINEVSYLEAIFDHYC